MDEEKRENDYPWVHNFMTDKWHIASTMTGWKKDTRYYTLCGRVVASVHCSQPDPRGFDDKAPLCRTCRLTYRIDFT